MKNKTTVKTLREILAPRVRKMYDENFKLNGLWNHYIIHPEQQGNKEFADYVLNEVWNNAAFNTRAYYVKKMQMCLKKNKSLEDWQKFAEEFVAGFDEEGYVELSKKVD